MEAPGGLRRAGEPTWRYETSRATLGEVRDGSGDPRGGRDGSGDPQGGPGRLGGTSERSGAARGNLEEVWDGSGDPV